MGPIRRENLLIPDSQRPLPFAPSSLGQEAKAPNPFQQPGAMRRLPPVDKPDPPAKSDRPEMVSETGKNIMKVIGPIQDVLEIAQGAKQAIDDPRAAAEKIGQNVISGVLNTTSGAINENLSRNRKEE